MSGQQQQGNLLNSLGLVLGALACSWQLGLPSEWLPQTTTTTAAKARVATKTTKSHHSGGVAKTKTKTKRVETRNHAKVSNLTWHRCGGPVLWVPLEAAATMQTDLAPVAYCSPVIVHKECLFGGLRVWLVFMCSASEPPCLGCRVCEYWQ